MFKKGQGYIVYLILFFISMNIVYSAFYISIRQNQIRENLFLQVKCGRLAESGINYYQKIAPELADNLTYKNINSETVLTLSGLTVTLPDGSFKLVRNSNRIYSIGLYQRKSVIYMKEESKWHHYTK